MNLLLRRFEAAQRFFTQATGGSNRALTPAQRAFAAFGMARANAGLLYAAGSSNAGSDNQQANRQRQARVAQTKTLYQQSLKDFANGSWHDETLRDLALLIERQAAERFPPPDAGAGNNPQAERQAKALVTARAEALPYWLDLSKRFHASRHAAQAWFHAGIIQGDLEKPDEAIRALEILVKKHAGSRYAGDAAVRLIDVRLEQQFDLPGAAALAEMAVAWFEERQAAPVADDAGYIEYESHALRTMKQAGYDIYLRAGLVEYLRERPEGALAFFDKAAPHAPPRNFVVVHGTIPTGLEKLIELAKNGKTITPEEARQGDEKARLILMLADVYHEADEWAKSLELCNKIIGGAAKKASREQLSWALFKRGRNYFCLPNDEFNPDAAYIDYMSAIRVAPKASWSDKALFLAANIQWNQKSNANAAIELWNRLLRTYPQSREADRSAYYIGMAYLWSNRPAEAERAFQSFLKQYPDSRFASSVRKHLVEIRPMNNP